MAKRDMPEIAGFHDALDGIAIRKFLPDREGVAVRLDSIKREGAIRAWLKNRAEEFALDSHNIVLRNSTLKHASKPRAHGEKWVDVIFERRARLPEDYYDLPYGGSD